MSTITGTAISTGITLATSGNYASPLTITATGTVDAGSGNAIFGDNSASWTLVNYGTVETGTGSGNGIRFGGAGAIVNGSLADTAALIAGGAGAIGTTDYQGSLGDTGGVGIFLASGTIGNYGRVKGGAGGGGGYSTGFGYHGGTGGYGGVGIYLANGGSITNSGTVTGGYGGDGGDSHYYGFSGIGGNGGVGIYLANGGGITNTGTVTGGVAGVGGTYAADGSDGVGIILAQGGAVTNGVAGVISGSIGIAASGAVGSTVVDYGTISGSTYGYPYGYAVRFTGGGANLLALGDGYTLKGPVGGSTAVGASNTLELLGGALVDYRSLAPRHFDDVLFGTGGSATLFLSDITGTLGVTISGFDQPSETIDLDRIGADGAISNFDTVSNLMTVSGSGGSVTFKLDGSDAAGFTTAPDGGPGGTLLTPVCYCRGTRILTPLGEVAVEELAIGDLVATLSGVARPVKWIGRRAYDGRFVTRNRAVLPVRITAGALADGVPARDLRVSPGHALYIDGALVRAEHLLNGATIVQEEAVELVEYFHIELETHDILIADGAPAESYVDCDNRGRFHNTAEFRAVYPDDERPRWQYCAPLLEWSSAALDAIRAALLQRAIALGHRLDLDPDFHLVADGVVVRPASVEDRVYRFAIPAGSASVLLASRSVAPAEIEAHTRDRRTLGVPVARIALYDSELRIEAGHGHAGLAEGFHNDETTHRWTNGRACLPDFWLQAFPGAVTLEVQLFPSGLPYRRSPDHARVAA